MRQQVSTEQAPAALGPYSQAVIAGGFVFCSGMAGIDPVTGAIPAGIEAQTEQALRNLDAVLAAAGASLQDVVKTTIFYADVADFQRPECGLCPAHARSATRPLRTRKRHAAERFAGVHRGDRGGTRAVSVIPHGADDTSQAGRSWHLLERAHWVCRSVLGLDRSGRSC